MVSRLHQTLTACWRWALACFILAGLTGVAFRVGIAVGDLPLELRFSNVRRAHSHLMFFSWVSPALMALIAHRLSRRTEGRTGRAIGVILWANLGLGLASFVPFLLDGYGATALLGADMPLSILFSTASMIAWYAFVWWYFKRRKGLAANTAIALWDVALIALVVGSFGAWARGVLMALGVEEPLYTDGVIHLFLGYFSEGWLVLGALGLLHDHLGVEMEGPSRLWTGLVAVGLAPMFVLGIPRSLVPEGLWTLASVAGCLVGLGLLGHVWVLWRRHWRSAWALPLAALGAKALANVAFVVPSVAAFAQGAGLRLLYLHVIFVGFVSLVLFEAARRIWRNVTRAQSGWMQAAVAFLLVAMLPTTGLWPAAGELALWGVAAGALAPVIVAVWIFTTAHRGHEQTRHDHGPARRPRLDDRAGASPPNRTPQRTGGR